MDGFGRGLSFGFGLRGFVGRFGFNLAGGLVFRQVELLFNLALALGQFLIAFLAVELRADPAFEFSRAFLRVANGGFEFARWIRVNELCRVLWQ